MEHMKNFRVIGLLVIASLLFILAEGKIQDNSPQSFQNSQLIINSNEYKKFPIIRSSLIRGVRQAPDIIDNTEQSTGWSEQSFGLPQDNDLAISEEDFNNIDETEMNADPILSTNQDVIDFELPTQGNIDSGLSMQEANITLLAQGNTSSESPLQDNLNENLLSLKEVDKNELARLGNITFESQVQEHTGLEVPSQENMTNNFTPQRDGKFLITNQSDGSEETPNQEDINDGLVNQENKDIELLIQSNGDLGIISQNIFNNNSLPQGVGNMGLSNEENGNKGLTNHMNTNNVLVFPENGNNKLPMQSDGNLRIISQNKSNDNSFDQGGGTVGLSDEKYGIEELENEENGNVELPIQDNGDFGVISQNTLNDNSLLQGGGNVGLSSEANGNEGLSNQGSINDELANQGNINDEPTNQENVNFELPILDNGDLRVISQNKLNNNSLNQGDRNEELASQENEDFEIPIQGNNGVQVISENVLNDTSFNEGDRNEGLFNEENGNDGLENQGNGIIELPMQGDTGFDPMIPGNLENNSLNQAIPTQVLPTQGISDFSFNVPGTSDILLPLPMQEDTSVGLFVPTIEPTIITIPILSTAPKNNIIINRPIAGDESVFRPNATPLQFSNIILNPTSGLESTSSIPKVPQPGAEFYMPLTKKCLQYQSRGQFITLGACNTSLALVMKFYRNYGVGIRGGENLVSLQSGTGLKCLSTLGRNIRLGAVVGLQDCGPSRSQRWKIVNHKQVQLASSGLCIEMKKRMQDGMYMAVMSMCQRPVGKSQHIKPQFAISVPLEPIQLPRISPIIISRGSPGLLNQALELRNTKYQRCIIPVNNQVVLTSCNDAGLMKFTPIGQSPGPTMVYYGDNYSKVSCLGASGNESTVDGGPVILTTCDDMQVIELKRYMDSQIQIGNTSLCLSIVEINDPNITWNLVYQKCDTTGKDKSQQFTYEHIYKELAWRRGRACIKRAGNSNITLFGGCGGTSGITKLIFHYDKNNLTLRTPNGLCLGIKGDHIKAGEGLVMISCEPITGRHWRFINKNRQLLIVDRGPKRKRKRLRQQFCVGREGIFPRLQSCRRLRRGRSGASLGDQWIGFRTID